MADILRQTPAAARKDREVIQAYIARLKSRPAFQKAYEGQLAHFAKGDEGR